MNYVLLLGADCVIIAVLAILGTMDMMIQVNHTHVKIGPLAPQYPVWDADCLIEQTQLHGTVYVLHKDERRCWLWATDWSDAGHEITERLPCTPKNVNRLKSMVENYHMEQLL